MVSGYVHLRVRSSGLMLVGLMMIRLVLIRLMLNLGALETSCPHRETMLLSGSRLSNQQRIRQPCLPAVHLHRHSTPRSCPVPPEIQRTTNAGSVGKVARWQISKGTWSATSAVQKTRSVSNCIQSLVISGKWSGSI